MTKHQSTAPGKIILSGEYAVLFNYPGIAIPAALRVKARFEEDACLNDIEVRMTNDKFQMNNQWNDYINQIIDHCISLSSTPPGTLTIENTIPPGKGMGASTAFVIAIVRCLLGPDCEEEALAIEETVNPGGSGIDFEVIWKAEPIKFQKESQPEPINLPDDLLAGALLVDTGTPDQQTPELVAWITERKDDLKDALKTIGSCTDRLLEGEDIRAVIRDHHKAQVSLGIVTDEAKNLITKIEQQGGAAKVIGAGSRTGGCGMILALGARASIIPSAYPVIALTPNY